MKPFVTILLALTSVSTALGQYVVGDTVPVPVTRSNDMFVAQWYSPPYVPRTNAVQLGATVWVSEFSTNGVNWIITSDQIGFLKFREERTQMTATNTPCLDCLFITQTFTNYWHPNPWLFRLRMVAYPPPS